MQHLVYPHTLARQNVELNTGLQTKQMQAEASALSLAGEGLPQTTSPSKPPLEQQC